MDLATQPGRPRRSSFTQQLQRLLHFDKTGNRRQSNVFQPPTDLQTKPVSDQQTSEDPDCRVATRTNECEYQPHIQLSSTDAVPSETESRFYSTHGPALGPPANRSSTKEGAESSNGSNVAQKNRRATMRLEADRTELEKRLLKLEQAGNTQDSTMLRRESRRLTKKQPMGSSSRASSASADETKTSSRFSSVFSRRTSRSRSSSTDKADKYPSQSQSIQSEMTVRDKPSEQRHDAPSPVPTTLPVRLGAAISEGLAVKNNALLPYSNQPTQSQSQSQLRPGTIPPDTVSLDKKPTFADGVVGGLEHGSNPHDGSNPSLINSGSSDLDRASFAATLKLGRGSDTMQTEGSHQQNTKARRKPSTTSGNSHVASIPNSQPPTSNQHPSLTRTVPVRSLTENMMQRNSKKFTSSPLAGVATVNDPDRRSSAASTDRINLRAPTTARNGRTTGTSFPHALLSSRAMDRSNGPETVTRNSPLDTGNKMKNIPMSPSSHIAKTPSSGSRRSSDSGETTTSNHAKRCSATTLDHRPKANPTNQPIGSPLRRKSQRRCLPENTGQDESATVEPALEKVKTKAIRRHTNVEEHFDFGKVDTKQNAPGHEADMSKISLSSDISQDQGSEEYDTADENAPTPPPVDDHPASTPRGSASAPLEKEKGPKNAISSAVLPRHKEPVNKVERSAHEQAVTKLFVICCHCKSWHDMPSEVYATLSAGAHAPTDRHSAALESRHSRSNSGLLSRRSSNSQYRSKKVQRNVGTASGLPPSSTVKCCWCEHYISRTCCEAWTTAVRMCERQFWKAD